MHNPNRNLFVGDEKVIYIENDSIRLGVNLDLGGAVTYLAEHGRKNLINSFDWGRQVQMSEPKTSEPLHSSCTRQATRCVPVASLAASPIT